MLCRIVCVMYIFLYLFLVFVFFFCCFFFFKQKTAYEMLISDWSSDVCSSDLDEAAVSRQRLLAAFLRLYRARDVDFIAGETITYGDQGEVGGQGPRSNRDAANPQAVRQYPRSGGNAQPDRGAARIL